MTIKYNHREIEAKWRKNWEEHPVNVNDGKKKKYYCLDMFPYPSGNGLQCPAGSRHHQEVAQVAVPSYAAHLGHGKALYGLVLVAVARSVVSARYRIGAHLHHAEGRSGPGECLAQPVRGPGLFRIRTGADEGVHIFGRALLFPAASHQQQDAGCQ